MMYKCTKCSISKEINEFYKDAQKTTGHRPDCKKCSNKRAKQWVHKNVEQRRFNVLKSSTGVTKKQYLDLLKDQNNTCAICNKSIKDNNRNLSVDHCHTKELVRGLLCTKCNFGIGYFNDDEKLLEKAIYYLNNNYLHKNIKYITPLNKRNNARKKKKSERAK